MATKKELLDIAHKSQWDYVRGEQRCSHCGAWRWEGSHIDDETYQCPLGALLLLIEENVVE